MSIVDRLRRYLLGPWIAKRGLEPPLPQDHEPHLVRDAYSGGQMCCASHERHFERKAKAWAPPAAEWPEHLSPEQRTYISDRLGHISR